MAPNIDRKVVTQERLRRRVLIIEDHPDLLRLMAVLLRSEGYDVRTADDGPSGIEVARAFQPDVVLLDIGLPGMDGYEVAQLLRQEDHGRNALIIAVTAFGREEIDRRAAESSFNYHLVKPVALDELTPLLNC